MSPFPRMLRIHSLELSLTRLLSKSSSPLFFFFLYPPLLIFHLMTAYKWLAGVFLLSISFLTRRWILDSPPPEFFHDPLLEAIRFLPKTRVGSPQVACPAQTRLSFYKALRVSVGVVFFSVRSHPPRFSFSVNAYRSFA